MVPIVVVGTAAVRSAFAVVETGTAISTVNVLANQATAGLPTAREQPLTQPMIAVIINHSDMCKNK